MKQTERNRNVFPGVGIGATSILIIFVLLCLVVFAMLSFVNANADRKLNRKLADRTQAYYEACEKAEALLEDIDLHLEQFYLENRGTYLSSCLSYLENAGGITGIDEEEQAVNFLFSVTVNDTQYLSVSISIPDTPAPGEHYYTITDWQTKSSQAWEPDTHLPVFSQ